MKIYRGVALILTIIFMAQFSFGQTRQVKFDQLHSLQKLEKRPIVVFLHTSWCKYCSSMKNRTLKSKEVAQLLNDNFYFVSLDIEEKKDIIFHGHTFKYKPTGTSTGVHELAEQLGTINGTIAYPGICFLNADYEIIYQKEGFIRAEEFLNMLKIMSFKYP